MLFTRNSDVFASNILIPDLILHLSVYSGFWIDPYNAQARVAICIISGLSFRILMASISEKMPKVTYRIWVVDYMIASQFISVFALVHYAAVAYYLSNEHKRLKLLEGFKKSKLPRLLKSGAIKASTVFQQAELKYQDFMASSTYALKQKAKKDSKNGEKGGGGYVSTIFKTSHHKRNKNRHKKNKIGDFDNENCNQNKMLDMIKIEESENEDEHDTINIQDKLQNIDNILLTPPNGVGLQVHDTSPTSATTTNRIIVNEKNKQDMQLVSIDLDNNVNKPDDDINKIPLKAKVNQTSYLNQTSIGSLPNSSRRSSLHHQRSFESARSSNNQNYYYSDTSSSRGTSHSRNTSIDRVMVMLTTYEVLTISYMKEAFELFDADHNGVLSIYELKMCFRAFGKYYTTNQMCALLESFRTSQRSSLGKRPTLHFVDFFCLLVELEDHEPLPEFETNDFLAIPPHLILDMLMRVAFPIIVGLKVLVCFMILENY